MSIKKVFTTFVVITTCVWSMGLFALPVTAATTVAAGDRVQMSGSKAVYLLDSNMKRWVFPNEATYETWYPGPDYSGLKVLTADEIAAYPLAGKNVAYRPGQKAIKVDTDPKVYSLGPGGVLHHIASEEIYIALYGSNAWKDIDVVPDWLFASYTVGTQLTTKVHPDGTLVNYAGDDNTYVISSGKKRLISSAEAFAANRFDSDKVITTTIAYEDGTQVTGAETNYTDPTQAWVGNTTGGDVTTGTGAVTLTLSQDTPAANYIAKGGQNVIMTKLNVTAGTSDAKVSKVLVTRGGLSMDADVDIIRLFDGATQLGTDQSLNTNTHKATFSSLNWTVPANTTKVLTIKINVNSAPSGTNVSMGIAAGDLTLTDGGTVAGLPVTGNAMAYSNLFVGTLNVDALSTSSTDTQISGSTDQEFGCWNFASASKTSGSTTVDEGFSINSVKLTHIGTAANNEVLNLKLKQGSTVIASATGLTNGEATFDMTATPYVLAKSTTKKICVYGDILGGITTTKTIRFQVADTKDVSAVGDSSHGEALITYSSATAFVTQSAKTVNISQGTVTVAQDGAYAPTSGTAFVKGVPSNKMASYKVTAGATEGVKLAKLRVLLEGTGVATTDFTNWKLYKIVDGAEVEIPVNGSVSGSYITWQDTNDGLLQVEKSGNKTLIVRADVTTSAAGTETGAKISIGSSVDNNTIRFIGMSSGDYIPNASISLSGVATGNAQTFTIGANGTLTVSLSPTSPSTATISTGTSNLPLTKVNFYATGEDITITDLQVIVYEASGVTNPVETGEVTNVRLVDDAGNALGTTVSNPTSGAASFSFSYTVAKEKSRTILVYADVPSGSTAAYVHVDCPGDYDADTDADNTDTAAAVTSTGVYSSATISETGTATGNLMTVGTTTVTATMATTPKANYYVINSTAESLGTLVLSNNNVEDVKVTSIKITADDAASLATASAASTNFNNIKLVDATDPTVQYGLTLNLTDGDSAADYVTFSGITNLTITKGGVKNILIQADIVGNSTAWYFGVLNPSTDISGVGVSNVAATFAGSSVVASQAATLAAKGSISFSADASTPATKLVAVGQSGTTTEQTMLVARANPLYENADVTYLKFTLNGGVAADFQTNGLKLYHRVGTGTDKLIASTNVVGTSIEFNLASDSLVFVKDQVNYLTVKALLNGSSNGVSANDAPAIDFGNGTNADDDTFITVKGKSSGATYVDADLNSTNAINVDGTIQTLRKVVPTVNSVNLSTAALATGSENELMKFTITAGAQENLAIKQIGFNVNITDNVGIDNTLTIGTLKFYRGTTNLSSSANVDVEKSDGTELESSGTIAEGSSTIYVYFDNEEVIPAGSTYTYILAGTPAGFATPADDDYIKVRLAADTTAQTATYLYVIDGDATSSEILGKLCAANGTDCDAVASFLWSDNSVSNHLYSVTDNSTTVGTSADWFNGYQVDIMPTSWAQLTI